MLNWIKGHFSKLHQLQTNATVTDQQGNDIGLDGGFKFYIDAALETRARNSKIMFVGNGGSAGICSHLAIDHSKNGQLPSMAFSDASAITCLSNDYGYDHVFAKQIEYHGRQNDFLIAISSSGKSVNILNAVAAARKLGIKVVTFTGFERNNPLNKLGDVNFFVDSKEYGFVEVAHLALGHTVLDYIIENHCNHTEFSAHTSLAAVE
jgi:D-sedoheptulose 7-phosphate isomerase